MNVNRVLDIKGGDTLETARAFLAGLLRSGTLDALVVAQQAADGAVSAELVNDPAAIARSNPFAPVMMNNAAAAVARATRQDSRRSIGAVLRPCEVRALVELSKRGRARLVDLTVIGLDCLGTFNPPDYRLRLGKSGGIAAVTDECMQVAREGEITRQTRRSCQICERPAPRGADVTLGFIGVDAQTELLVIAADESADSRLRLAEFTSRMAREDEVARREAALTHIIARHNAAAERELADLETSVGGLAGVLTALVNCTECRACLQACPLYDGELDDTSLSLIGQIGAVGRWLVSCSGCGMCEESCPNGVPLSVLARALSRPLRNKLGYTPGQSVNDKLPWAAA